MTAELFNDLPFNLAGEVLRSEIDEEGERRVEAENKANERKAQTEFEQMKRDNKPYLLSKDGKTAYKISL